MLAVMTEHKVLKLHTFPFKAMGTYCELQLYASEQADANYVAQVAITELKRMEAVYSRYQTDSLTSKINQAAGSGKSIAVDAMTAAIFDYSAVCFELSSGLFDITSGILRQAWDFKNKRVPSQAEIDVLLPRIGWDKVIWDKPNFSLSMAGMEIDFGGVVKEFAVDAAATKCRELGVKYGLINMGGDLCAIGAHPNGRPWMVGVQHPHVKANVYATLPLKQGAIASSGDYERYIEINGHRYGHILNPKTGQPVSGLVAVSVVAPECVVAGSTCTIAMLMEEQKGIDWLMDIGLPFVCMDQEGRITKGG